MEMNNQSHLLGRQSEAPASRRAFAHPAMTAQSTPMQQVTRSTGEL